MNNRNTNSPSSRNSGGNFKRNNNFSNNKFSKNSSYSGGVRKSQNFSDRQESKTGYKTGNKTANDFRAGTRSRVKDSGFSSDKPFVIGSKKTSDSRFSSRAKTSFNRNTSEQSENKNSFSGSSARPQNRFSKFSRNSGGSSARGSFRNSSSRNSSRGSSRGGSRFGKKAIDVSRFINKVTIVEEAIVFTPANKFADFHIDEKLKATIIEKGFVLPTPIQDKVIPHILQGQDVVGMANTGTGKTAAFLIPLIDKVIKDKTQKVLIIVPTRELATQINDDLRSFVKGMSIFSCVCVGGASMSIQIKDLARNHNFVIGTPGRLKDLIERRFINLKTFNNFVLDEADRMLDMGFINDIKQIVKQMPEEKHGLFFSATLSTEIEMLIKNFLKEPLKISVKTQEVSKNIEQDIIKVKREEKMEELIKLLSKEEFSKVLVFGQTKHGVEKIFKTLKDKGFKVDSIHGNKTQGHRQKTLTKFKKDEINILIATDVAARGLDINNISHVINYDTPDNHEDYIHRIGRTGRGDKKGKALTFVH
jgi:ATP-dependent RNA helicase RhlE